MPRTARIKSASGIYHVIMRGINRQRIFEDEEDYRKYLWELNRFQKVCGYELYAWCLMPNHIHILIKEGNEPLEQVFRRIGASFIYWYNMKYERVGHLFQDRYKSEPVEDDAYLLTVVRYIHHNPVKAGLCRWPEDYRYSSYTGYLRGDKLLCSEAVLKKISIDQFVEYHRTLSTDECLEVSETVNYKRTDAQISKLMKDRYGIQSVAQVLSMDSKTQAEVVRMMQKSGGSVRQISRLTGISLYSVKKHLQHREPSPVSKKGELP